MVIYMFNIVDLVTPFDFENNIDYESLLKIIKTILESKKEVMLELLLLLQDYI